MSSLPSVEQNLFEISRSIREACLRSNRNPDEIKIIAVTKYVSIERAEEAIANGVIDLGENRDEGLLQKWDVLANKASFHFIGSLQSKKVKKIIDKVDYIHSLDRESLAEELHKRATGKIKCFVQVNVSGEASKHGLSKDEVKGFIEKLASYDNIIVIGLMTMAPYTDDEAALRTCFREMKNLQQEIQKLHLGHAPCTELSMGMSNDYQIAIEEGATFIRIGSALVGNEQ